MLRKKEYASKCYWETPNKEDYQEYVKNRNTITSIVKKKIEIIRKKLYQDKEEPERILQIC